MKRWSPETVKMAACSLITVTVIVVVWELVTRLGEIPAYVVPSPAAVAEAFRSGLIDGTLYRHIGFTVLCTLTGLLAGCVAGLLIGALVAEFRPLELSIYPLVIGLQSVPKIAIAPLIVAYLGFGIESKVFTVGLLCFFPVFVNTVVGLHAVDAGAIDLYRVFSASRWRQFLDVRLPASADHIFAGLQIAVVLGLIGCIVSEFIASTEGLGFIIKARAGQLDVSMMFAAILILAMLGATGTLLVRLAHGVTVFWSPTAKQRTAPLWRRRQTSTVREGGRHA